MRNLAILAIVLAACSEAPSTYEPPPRLSVIGVRNTPPRAQSLVPASARRVQVGVEETISSLWVDRMFYDRQDDADLQYAFTSEDSALSVRVEGVGDSATAYLLANRLRRPVRVTLTASDPDSATASHSWRVSITQVDSVSATPRSPTSTPPPPTTPVDTLTTYCVSDGSNCTPPGAPGIDASKVVTSTTSSEGSVDTSGAWTNPENWGTSPTGAWDSGAISVWYSACPVVGGSEDCDHASASSVNSASFSAGFTSAIEGWRVTFAATALNGNRIAAGRPGFNESSTTSVTYSLSVPSSGGGNQPPTPVNPPPSPLAACDRNSCSRPSAPVGTLTEVATESAVTVTASWTVTDWGSGPDGAYTDGSIDARYNACPYIRELPRCGNEAASSGTGSSVTVSAVGDSVYRWRIDFYATATNGNSSRENGTAYATSAESHIAAQQVGVSSQEDCVSSLATIVTHDCAFPVFETPRTITQDVTAAGATVSVAWVVSDWGRSSTETYTTGTLVTGVFGRPIINGVVDRNHSAAFSQTGSSVSVSFDSDITGWYLVFSASATNGNSELGANAARYYATTSALEFVTVSKP